MIRHNHVTDALTASCDQCDWAHNTDGHHYTEANRLLDEHWREKHGSTE